MRTSIIGALALAFAGASAQTTTTATNTASPTTTGSPKPSPTQPGLIDTCTTFYKAVLGDTCQGIVNQNNGAFTLSQFYAWNPAVNTPGPCLGLWADTYYCIGAPGASGPTTTLTTVTTTTSAGNGIATPQPTQPGIVANCNRFYLVKQDDTCQGIAADWFVTPAELRQWNTQVGERCERILAGYYACTNVQGRTIPRSDTCYAAGSDKKTWGDNQPAAITNEQEWCRGAAQGDYAVGQTRTGCFNAPLGTNKFTFTITNKWTGAKTLASPAQCMSFLNNAVRTCERGGEGQSEGWAFSGSVTAGRC